MVKHVFGTAFPRVDLTPAGVGELELQFLRMAYAVHRKARSGDGAVGYFVVLRQETRERALRLKAGYEVGDRVRVVFAELLVSEMTALAEAAETAERTGDVAAAAMVGRAIGLDALRREVAAGEPGVVESDTDAAGPFGLVWDYYGTVSTPPD